MNYPACSTSNTGTSTGTSGTTTGSNTTTPTVLTAAQAMTALGLTTTECAMNYVQSGTRLAGVDCFASRTGIIGADVNSPATQP